MTPKHRGQRVMMGQRRLPLAVPSFTCRDCGFTSYNLNDVKHRYCGRCHKFMTDPKSDAEARARAQRFSDAYRTLLPKAPK
jgi:RNase P subunit RPR2